MTELDFLDSYSGESTDELISMESKYRIDSLVLAFEQALDQKIAKVGQDKLTIPEMTILAIEAMEREVNNGGYSQFFINSSKEYASILVDSIKRIGCPKTAEISQKAISALNISKALTPDSIDAVLEQENEERDRVLGECDDDYYSTQENIAVSLFNFIKNNRKSINLT